MNRILENACDEQMIKIVTQHKDIEPLFNTLKKEIEKKVLYTLHAELQEIRNRQNELDEFLRLNQREKRELDFLHIIVFLMLGGGAFFAISKL
jgi:hypothetical protein